MTIARLPRSRLPSIPPFVSAGGLLGVWLLTGVGCSLPPDDTPETSPATPAGAAAGLPEQPLAPEAQAVLETGIDVSDAGGQRQPLAGIAADLAARRVVYVGEAHDRYGHHLAQLAVIDALRRQDQGPAAGWAIGLEQVQTPFQPALDDYIAGVIDERELLRRIEYFDRWGFDFRLYRPIFRYARAHRLPLVALNVDRDMHRRFAAHGAGALSDDERAALPPLDVSDVAYRQRLRHIYSLHGRSEGVSDAEQELRFERFHQAQLLWDEAMAERVAGYLRGHPERSMVVLAGNGHLMFRSGIPNRVRRRLELTDALLLPVTATAHGEDGGGNSGRTDAGGRRPAALHGADYLLVAPTTGLPPAGRMGVAMAPDRTPEPGAGTGPQSGGVEVGVGVQEVIADSAAAAAGVRVGDRIVALDGMPVARIADVRTAMLDRKPGDAVTLKVLRDGADRTLELRLR